MKYLLLFFSVVLFAYEAKVEPVHTYHIKAAVNGIVIKSAKNFEGKNISDKLIIRLDDNLEKSELENIENQIEILKKQIKNQIEIVKRKKALYEKYKQLKSKSIEQKDMKFFDYISAKNQLLNLQNQLNSLYTQQDKIKDILDKKNIRFSGYLYSVNVEKGDYVNIGRELALGYDISKQKLDIYVPIEKIDEIKNKKIYINGKKSNFKISKIWNVTDTKYITSYKVELIGNGLKFGEVVKIDFKKE